MIDSEIVALGAKLAERQKCFFLRRAFSSHDFISVREPDNIFFNPNKHKNQIKYETNYSNLLSILYVPAESIDGCLMLNRRLIKCTLQTQLGI